MTNDFADLSDRDYAHLLLPNLNYEAQLVAINDLLQRHARADRMLGDEIKKTQALARRSRGFRNERATDEWVDLLNTSVYQDSAHSMSAVGMLAPLVESIFHQALLETRTHYETQSTHPPKHLRWKQADQDKWDCHFFWNKGRRNVDLVEGIFQLSEAVGLTSYLPENLRTRLKALFSYRNKMFHCGFEWPAGERANFADMIKREKWDDWFSSATRKETQKKEEPWIFYIKESFVEDCVSTTERIIEAVGRFAKELNSAQRDSQSQMNRKKEKTT